MPPQTLHLLPVHKTAVKLQLWNSRLKQVNPLLFWLHRPSILWYQQNFTIIYSAYWVPLDVTKLRRCCKWGNKALLQITRVSDWLHSMSTKWIQIVLFFSNVGIHDSRQWCHSSDSPLFFFFQVFLISFLRCMKSWRLFCTPHKQMVAVFILFLLQKWSNLISGWNILP